MSLCAQVRSVANFWIVFQSVWNQKTNRYQFSLGFAQPILLLKEKRVGHGVPGVLVWSLCVQ